MDLHKTPLVFNGLSQAAVKLDRTNYVLWKSLILPIIRRYKLEGCIIGTKACPNQFVQEGGQQKSNPEFEEWRAQDQLLLDWLFNSMTIEIAS
ncbi:hypothetical protein L6164_016721 [Bauhinia variegata]|uniref:Uncharacterized protein n=1 Tax=Bauhinia variegata TaxID=167791 RepID=A0ACB9N7I5_BAUVA|nr:hypothetical protein L6164_016721 [Bauhinia variegata]